MSNPVVVFKDLFARAMSDLKQCAPKHITPERMVKVMTASISKTPGLQQCTPTSVLLALMTATELGLEPNTPLGHSYIVPIPNRGRMEAQFWPGYRGLVYLAVQSGQVLDVRSQVVRAKDTWRFKDGRGGVDWEWMPSEEEDRGNVRLIYAAAELVGEREHIEVMTFAQVEKIRRNAGSSKKRSPWDDHWDEMARKTVIKRLCKHLPMSTERSDLLVKAIEVDNAQNGDDDGTTTGDVVAQAAAEEAAHAMADDAGNVPANDPGVPADPQAPQLQADTRVPVEQPTTQAEKVRQQVAAKRATQQPAPGVSNSAPTTREPTDVEKAAAAKRAKLDAAEAADHAEHQADKAAKAAQATEATSDAPPESVK